MGQRGKANTSIPKCSLQRLQTLQFGKSFFNDIGVKKKKKDSRFFQDLRDLFPYQIKHKQSKSK